MFPMRKGVSKGKKEKKREERKNKKKKTKNKKDRSDIESGWTRKYYVVRIFFS